MPRQTRRLPVGITRFTYWSYDVCFPRTAANLARRSRLRDDPVQAELRARFLRHLHAPCRARYCSADPKLTGASPVRRAQVALADYIETSREWERDPDAWQVFRRLSPLVRERLSRRSDRLYGRAGHRPWRTILGTIASDLRSFERMLPRGPASVTKSTDPTYPPLSKVWTPYAHQTLVLFDRPAVTAGTGPQRARLDLRWMTAQAQAQVFHWFAHAFRNLVRYRNGHPPLSFEPACALACRAAVMRF